LPTSLFEDDCCQSGKWPDQFNKVNEQENGFRQVHTLARGQRKHSSSNKAWIVLFPKAFLVFAFGLSILVMMEEPSFEQLFQRPQGREVECSPSSVAAEIGQRPGLQHPTRPFREGISQAETVSSIEAICSNTKSVPVQNTVSRKTSESVPRPILPRDFAVWNPWLWISLTTTPEEFTRQVRSNTLSILPTRSLLSLSSVRTTNASAAILTSARNWPKRWPHNLPPPPAKPAVRAGRARPPSIRCTVIIFCDTNSVWSINRHWKPPHDRVWEAFRSRAPEVWCSVKRATQPLFISWLWGWQRHRVKKSREYKLLSRWNRPSLDFCSIACHFQDMANPQVNSVQWWF